MAFHPYPHLIPPVCNLGGFGPPRPLTAASPWTWVDHPASGLQHTTQRPIQTRFRSGSPTRVNLAAYHNSQAHSSKGTPSPAHPTRTLSRALTDYRHMVSGTLSLPSRGTFHHSLTVLSTIGHRTTLGLPDGPGRFTRASTKPALLENTNRTLPPTFTYGTLTHSGRPSQAVQLINGKGTYPRQRITPTSHNPEPATPAGYHTNPV